MTDYEVGLQYAFPLCAGMNFKESIKKKKRNYIKNI